MISEAETSWPFYVPRKLWFSMFSIIHPSRWGHRRNVDEMWCLLNNE
jgi:hypothetical protein